MGCAAGTAGVAALQEARLREERASCRAEELAKRLQESEQERSQLQCRLEALEATPADAQLEDVQAMQVFQPSSSSKAAQAALASVDSPSSVATALQSMPGHASAEDGVKPAEGHDSSFLESSAGGHQGYPNRRTASDATWTDFVLPGGTACEAPSANGSPRQGASSSSSASWKRLTGTVNSERLGRDKAVGQQSPRTMDLPDLSQEELLRKPSGEESSTASTCTTVMQLLRETAAPCYQCKTEGVEVFLDHSDLNRYCELCWVQFYGERPLRNELLMPVEVAEIMSETRLERAWSERKLQGWPPVPPRPPTAPASRDAEVWSSVRVRLHQDVVGVHAREQKQRDSLAPSDVLAGRYRVQGTLGEGHFTKAFRAMDLVTGNSICIKRHHGLTVDALTDLMVLARRLEQADVLGENFPRLMDAFYDIVGYTVESLVDGQNCIAMARAEPGFFRRMENLRTVAQGALTGLVLLDRAGIVHNDLKPDNLVWADAAEGASRPRVCIVDFGCARLDRREEPGRNWSLAEGGAGHLGKWSPEMVLRLPITHRGDVWGLAISLCELHCGRCVWSHENDTAEVVLAQSLGLCGHREGLPSSLLRRSPLDVRRLYTPAPRHWPVRRDASGQLRVLRPLRWGLDAVLGEGWGAGEKHDLGEFLHLALVLDAEHRPSAAELLECSPFVAEQ